MTEERLGSSSVRLRRRGWWALVACLIGGVCLGRELTIVDSLTALMSGPVDSNAHQLIIWWVRLPQILAALLAGGVLSISGAAMQQLLRNELADPYLVGVASGGGLGAALALTLGLVDTLGLWALPLSSFLGALCASLWIELSTRYREAQDIHYSTHSSHLVLSGVALNLFLSALLTLTLSLSEERLGGVWRWLIGHIEVLTWGELSLMAIGGVICISLLLYLQRDIELMCGGEELAWTLGVNVKRVRFLTLVSVSIGVGAVVSFCGIIGFVGLLIPHFVRPRIIGESHHLFSLSLLYGAWVLGGCHLLSLFSPSPLPIGVVTGVLGGAVFLFMLTRRSSAGE